MRCSIVFCSLEKIYKKKNSLAWKKKFSLVDQSCFLFVHSHSRRGNLCAFSGMGKDTRPTHPYRSREQGVRPGRRNVQLLKGTVRPQRDCRRGVDCAVVPGAAHRDNHTPLQGPEAVDHVLRHLLAHAFAHS